MSLLMEALRKAEEAKRQAQEADSPLVDIPVLPEPVPDRPLRKKPLSQQSSLENEYSAVTPEPPVVEDMLETIDFNRPPPQTREPVPIAGVAAYASTQQARDPVADDSASLAAKAAEDELERYLNTTPEQEDVQIRSQERPRIKVAPEAQKRAAAAMFAAKSTSVKAAPGKTVLVMSLILMLPLAGAGVWYFNQGSSGLVSIPAQGRPPLGFLEDTQPRVIAEAADTAIEIPPAQSADAESAGVPQPADESAPPLSLSGSGEQTVAIESAPQTSQVAGVATSTNTANPFAALTARDNTEAPADPLGLPSGNTGTSLSVSRSKTVSQVNPQLLAAYNQLQSGDFIRASQLYQEVLSELPNNRDALLGLASVETRMGNTASARQLYSRLLKLNPQDSLARTGIVQSVQGTNSLEQETELKNLISQYPDLAPLALLQGNFYAGQGRWSEAQPAYFNALLLARRNSGPVSPDYAFNLAISLERLGQAAAALDYYRQASTLAQQSPPGFDLQLLQSRLRTLERSQP